MPDGFGAPPAREFVANCKDPKRCCWGWCTDLRENGDGVEEPRLGDRPGDLGADRGHGEGDETTARDTGSAVDGGAAVDAGIERVRILSAFMGLDSRIPGFGCGLSGLQDGMPIVLDRRIPLPALLDFLCSSFAALERRARATLAPANEAEERGRSSSLGSLPARRILRLESRSGTLLTDEGVDAQGALTETVVPLAAGPSIVLAEHYLISEPRRGHR